MKPARSRCTGAEMPASPRRRSWRAGMRVQHRLPLRLLEGVGGQLAAQVQRDVAGDSVCSARTRGSSLWPPRARAQAAPSRPMRRAQRPRPGVRLGGPLKLDQEFQRPLGDRSIGIVGLDPRQQLKQKPVGVPEHPLRRRPPQLEQAPVLGKPYPARSSRTPWTQRAPTGFRPTARTPFACERSPGPACTRAPLAAVPRAAPDPAPPRVRLRHRLDTRSAGSPPRAATTAAADAMWGVPGAHSGVREVRPPKGAQTYVGASNRPGATHVRVSRMFSAHLFTVTYRSCNILHSGTAAACLPLKFPNWEANAAWQGRLPPPARLARHPYLLRHPRVT